MLYLFVLKKYLKIKSDVALKFRGFGLANYVREHPKRSRFLSICQ